MKRLPNSNLPGFDTIYSSFGYMQCDASYAEMYLALVNLLSL